MRTRSRSDQLVFQSGSWKDISTTGVVTEGSVPSYASNSARMTDQVNPGYFRAEREGLLKPVSPMDKSSTKYLAFPGQFSGMEPRGSRYQHYHRSALFIPNGGIPTGPKLAVPSTNPNMLLQEALARAQTDAWDTATFLAELGKTIEGLTSFYSRWKRTYDRVVDAARKRRGRFRTFADAFSDAWLEYRYAIRPLVYDMRDISESIQRLQDGVESPLARGWATDESEATASKATRHTGAIYSSCLQGNQFVGCGGRLSSGADFFDTHQLSTRVHRVTERATVGVQVTTRAVTLMDPAVTTWELVPFSFIADWFINVGDAIAAFSPFATGTFKYATYTVTHEEILTFHGYVSPRAGSRALVSSMSPSVVEITNTTSRRTLHTVAPNLSFRVNVDAAKVLDLVTLAWALKGNFRKLVSVIRH